MEKRTLRKLTPQEETDVSAIYKLFAVALGKNDPPGVLARNRFVDATLAELMEAVPDKLLLLSAWVFWIGKRNLRELPWPVSQFQKELDGALAGVGDDYNRFQQRPKAVLDYDGPLATAYKMLQGGAR